MPTLRYSTNVTLDGSCHHLAMNPNEEMHQFHTENMVRAHAVLYGRVTYQMMEEAWRKPDSGEWPEEVPDWMVPFAEAMHKAKKYVVSSTLTSVDWNSELVQGDLAEAVNRLKEGPGEGTINVGGVSLPLQLANLGLIDEYEFFVQPIVAGYGPTLLNGLNDRLQLEPIDRRDFESGATAYLYRPVMMDP